MPMASAPSRESSSPESPTSSPGEQQPRAPGPRPAGPRRPRRASPSAVATIGGRPGERAGQGPGHGTASRARGRSRCRSRRASATTRRGTPRGSARAPPSRGLRVLAPGSTAGTVGGCSPASPHARRRLVLAVGGAASSRRGVAGGRAGLARRRRRRPRRCPRSGPGRCCSSPGTAGRPRSLQALADRLIGPAGTSPWWPCPATGTGRSRRGGRRARPSAVDDAMARTGAESVDVVGYSAGGLVARLWVADGGADVARRVVTLGSPHHGTSLADLAGDLAPGQCPLGCLQLGTDSDLLSRLNAGDETPEGPTWVSIWTTQDRDVTPPDSARLEGALNLPVQSVCAQARYRARRSAARARWSRRWCCPARARGAGRARRRTTAPASAADQAADQARARAPGRRRRGPARPVS